MISIVIMLLVLLLLLLLLFVGSWASKAQESCLFTPHIVKGGYPLEPEDSVHHQSKRLIQDVEGTMCQSCVFSRGSISCSDSSFLDVRYVLNGVPSVPSNKSDCASSPRTKTMNNNMFVHNIG